MWFHGIDKEVRDAFRAVVGGWNGLRVNDDHHERYFDPEWDGDDYDYPAEASGAPIDVNIDDF